MHSPESELPIKNITETFLKLNCESIGCNSNHIKFVVELSHLVGSVCNRFSQSNGSQIRASEPTTLFLFNGQILTKQAN